MDPSIASIRADADATPSSPSASSLLLEEMSFHLYPKAWHLAALVLVAIVENFGYRQLNTFWRLVGLYRWAAQRESQWGAMKRKGNWQGK